MRYWSRREDANLRREVKRVTVGGKVKWSKMVPPPGRSVLMSRGRWTRLVSLKKAGKRGRPLKMNKRG